MSPRRADKKRVLIFSASYGGSHAGVADGLARYLRANHAARTEVRVVDFLEHFMPNVNVLAKFGYQQSLRFFPSGYATASQMEGREPDNPVVHELSTGGLDRVQNGIETFDPHAVISVLPVAAAISSELAPARGFFSAAVLTDLSAKGAWLHPKTNAHFVATKEVSDQLVLSGVEWDRVTVSGLPIAETAVAPKREMQRKALGLADRFTVSLIVLAGAGPEIADIALELAKSGIQVAISFEGSPRLSRQVSTALKASGLVRAFGRERGLDELVGVADLVVGRAGGSIVPLGLSLGVPLILYNPVPGEERGNVDFLVNCGAALLARDEEDVAEKVRFLSTHSTRLEQMAAGSRGLGRSDAAKTVCERVLAVLD